jgi:hypothetical protein
MQERVLAGFLLQSQAHQVMGAGGKEEDGGQT